MSALLLSGLIDITGGAGNGMAQMGVKAEAASAQAALLETKAQAAAMQAQNLGMRAEQAAVQAEAFASKAASASTGAESLGLKAQAAATRAQDFGVKAFAAAGQAEYLGTKATAAAVEAEKLGASAGGVGVKLAALGPAGIAAGVGIAAVGVALLKTAGDAAAWETKLVDVRNNTMMTDQQFNEMKDTISRVAQETGAPFNQLADGYMHVSNYGYQAADATKILEAATRSAVSTGGDAAQTANILAGAIHEFNLKGDDAVKVMDELHTGAAAGNLTLEAFTNSFGRVGATASALGVPLDQTIAAFSALTRHGIDAAESGTQVVDLMQHLVNPSRQARNEIKLLADTTGIDLTQDFTQAGISTKGFSGVLADIAAATHGNTDAFATLTGQTAPTAEGLQQVQSAASGNMQEMAKLVPNLRGLLGEFILTGNGAKDYADILTMVQNSNQGVGITNESMARTLDTTGGQAAILKDKLGALAFVIGGPLNESAKSFLITGNAVLDQFGAMFNATKAAFDQDNQWFNQRLKDIDSTGHLGQAIAATVQNLLGFKDAEIAANDTTVAATADMYAWGASAAETTAALKALAAVNDGLSGAMGSASDVAAGMPTQG